MTESDTDPATSKTRYSIAEAARLKGVHPNTVRKYVRQGRIKAELIRGPFGTEYAIPESELDSLGVPMLDTDQGQRVSLTHHPDTLTLAFQAALVELQSSHQQVIAAKDETIAVLHARVAALEEQVRQLQAPAESPMSHSAFTHNLTPEPVPTDQVPVETARDTTPPTNGPHSASQATPRPWWKRLGGWVAQPV